MIRRPPRSTRTDTLFPYTTRFRSEHHVVADVGRDECRPGRDDSRQRVGGPAAADRHRRRLVAAVVGQHRIEHRRLAVVVLRVVESLQVTHQCPADLALDDRSEEHTSELQSLMRISYAVFCLKTTKNQSHQQPAINSYKT